MQPQINPPIGLQVQARAKLQLRKRGITNSPLDQYQLNPAAYIRDRLGWSPWEGQGPDMPGQQEILDAYVLALRQQLERRAWERGELTEDELEYWKPGQVILRIIRVEAGHTVGKTKLVSGIVNHFFDCFVPSIIYTFAPSWEQIHDLLWKEIKADRRGKGLPGRILDLELRQNDNHFAKGKSTNNNHGTGTERVQGQHGEYLMFVLDEAEGIANYVYDAVDSMASGGIVIIILLANPKTNTSRFHRIRHRSDVQNFRISCLNHPNVIQNKELIPGAVRRDYIDLMLEEHAEEVQAHNEDDLTFELPWAPGVMYKPDRYFMFRVLGIAPPNSTHNTFIPTGRYEAAVKRPWAGSDENFRARFGVDVARYGQDVGTLYNRHDGWIKRLAVMDKLDTTVYYHIVKAEALKLPASVWSLHIRVDGTGGFGHGVIDLLKRDIDLRRRFREFQVFEVIFGATATDTKKYANLITELYADTAEVIKDLVIMRPPNALEADLTERTFEFVTDGKYEIKRLTSKDEFKKDHGHSPDDGDGFVLAAASDRLFARSRARGSQQMNWRDS